MNAERLLQHYEQIADAPDAIVRLRRFILNLAVRGKLVPQDQSDEAVPEVSLEIVEKQRGQLRAEISAPFKLPSGWRWRAVKTIAEQVTDGEHATPPRITETQVPLVTAKNVRDGSMDFARTDWVSFETAEKAWKRCKPVIGDLLLVCVGATTGRLAVLRESVDMVLVRSVALIRPSSEVSSNYLEKAFGSSTVQEQIWASVKVTAQPCLYINRIQSLSIPIPPIAEQQRIVAKVDELMALCDALEAARAERETKRDRLAAASLARLNTPVPETFRDDVRFALDALPALTARPDQIKQLRQTILNLAVRGKLVPQDPADEPAVELDKNLPSELPQPFKIPQSWRWSRLSAVGKLKGGGTPSKSNAEFWNGDIPWVSPKDMKIDYISESQMAITDKAVKGSSVNLIDRGSLLFVVRGMILAHSFPVAITREMVTVNQDMKALIPKTKDMAEYLLRALKGLKPQMLERVQRSSHGTCRLEGADYADFLIPIPPLAEQHRIVAKVDELMALCDELETSLTSAYETRKKLLDALLAEALAPVDADALQEAAE